jgi:hypothetical protein
MHSFDSSTARERETQIDDGLRWADCLLTSFGLASGVDVASLVALRAIEWADEDMPVREVRRILTALATVRPMAATTLHAQSRVCPSLSAADSDGGDHAAQ